MLYSCFASLTLTMCKAGDIFAKYETQFGASFSSQSWAKAHHANSTQIYGNHATGPVNCRSRRQAAEQTKKPERCNCWVSSYESIQQPFAVLVYKIKYELRYTDRALLIEQWCKRKAYKLTQTRCRTYRNSRTIYACAVQCSCPDKARPFGVTSVNG